MNNSLIIVVVLLAANAFFVAAEFALVKVKRFRVDALVDEGSRMAEMTQHMLHNIESYLASCQLGITMASLGLGWVGEPAVAALLKPLLHNFSLSPETLHTVAFITGFIIFSSLHIVVGEQVPKTFAIRKAEPVSLWIAYPLHWFYLCVFPLNWLLNAAATAILRLFGVEEAPHHEILSDDEIRGFIETSEVHGTMDSSKADMLHNLFEFDSRTVEAIMVPRGKVAVIDLDDPEEKQNEVLSRIEHSRFPVIRGGPEHICGVLLAKDLYSEILQGRPEFVGRLESLVRDAPVIPETKKLGRLFELMRSDRQHMALVIDEYGCFVGIVTMEDLLEEIVGEIADELDSEFDDTVLVKVDDHWQTDGWAQLADVSRALDITFGADIDANTLSGLFMCRLGRVPHEGDCVVEQGYEFTIESMSGRRVHTTTIHRLPPETAEEPQAEPR